MTDDEDVRTSTYDPARPCPLCGEPVTSTDSFVNGSHPEQGWRVITHMRVYYKPCMCWRDQRYDTCQCPPMPLQLSDAPLPGGYPLLASSGYKIERTVST